MFYLFDEKNYVSSLRSIFHLERSVYKYLHSIHDILIAIKYNDKNKYDHDDALITIKTHIIPLLQRIADLEGILYRKTLYIVEHTCPHTQIDALPHIPTDGFDERLLKIKELLSDINKKLKQVYPNYKIIDETIACILYLETKRKQFFMTPNLWKANNDPSQVWLIPICDCNIHGTNKE